MSTSSCASSLATCCLSCVPQTSCVASCPRGCSLWSLTLTLGTAASSWQVRSLNKELGGTTRQRIRLMAESAVRGLALDRGYTDTTRDADAPAPAIVAVDEQSGKRIDTDSVFDAHRINAPVDSELLAQQGSGGMSTRGWLRQWWDVRRLRFRMFVVDQAASWALWWRGTTAEEAMQRLEESAKRSGRKAGRQMG